MNWFQFVFLREDSQVIHYSIPITSGCELISICIFTWGFTRGGIHITRRQQLWIDFNLYFYVRIHKRKDAYTRPRSVVNWFQFVFLREDSQGFQYFLPYQVCCELISICIFTWGFTSCWNGSLSPSGLWIDFNLYFYVRIHKKSVALAYVTPVVNWFQFVFLREDSQAGMLKRDTPNRCELISICIFTWGFTSWLTN